MYEIGTLEEALDDIAIRRSRPATSIISIYALIRGLILRKYENRYRKEACPNISTSGAKNSKIFQRHQPKRWILEKRSFLGQPIKKTAPLRFEREAENYSSMIQLVR
jgi:hypothetical protein